MSTERRDPELIAADGADRVQLVALFLCDRCLDGAGGECHTPGCALYLNRAPDLDLREKIVAKLTLEFVGAS